MPSVCGSSSRKSSSSPKSMSSAPPSASTDEKPMPERGREVDQRRADRPRLRDQREAAGQRLPVADGDVEADVGADDAERLGAEQADPVLARRRQDVALPELGVRRIVRRRGEQHRAFHADGAAFVQQRDDGVAGRRDHREVDLRLGRGERRHRLVAEDLPVMRVDRIRGAAEAAGEQVLEHDAAERSRAFGRADQRHRVGHDQRSKAVLEHDGCRFEGRYCAGAGDRR